MVGLGAGAEPGLLDLYKIADMHFVFEHRTRPQPGEGANDRSCPDTSPSIWLKERMRAPSAILDAGTEEDIRLDHDIAAEPRIGAEKDGLGRYQRRPGRHRVPPQAVLHQRLGGGEVGASVDADQLFVPVIRRRGSRDRGGRATGTMSVR